MAMNVESLTVGLQRVDEAFSRGALGAKGFLCTPGAVTVRLQAQQGKLSYEWGVLVREEPLLVAKAKAELDRSMVLSFQLDTVESTRTKARLVLSQPPQLTCGMQAWDAKQSRLGATTWSQGATHGNAALPPLMLNELNRATVHELVFMHTKNKVAKDFKQAGIASCTAASAPPPKGAKSAGVASSPSAPRAAKAAAAEISSPAPNSRKRAGAADVSTVKKPRPKKAAPAEAAKPPEGAPAVATKEEAAGGEMGSNGEQCDWCGLTPGEGEGELKVCKRCHYTCCGECGSNQTKGTCYCKDSNFGEAYPKGAARKRYMTGLW